MIALALLLWPKKDWHLEPEKLFAFITAGVTWAISLFPERQASQHDLELFAKFQTVITPSWITWLRRHDFGGSFQARHAAPLFEIDGEWEGAAYVFDDPHLQSEFEPLLEQLVTFAGSIARKTWPVGLEWQTAVPDGESSLEESYVRARVEVLNEGSARLAEAIDRFVISARRRLHSTHAGA